MLSVGQTNQSLHRERNGKDTIMKAELVCMIEKFPGLIDKIMSLYESSSEFQTLCFDYFLCLKSLNQWEMNMKKDQTFIQEYGGLKKILETEILQLIEKPKLKAT